MLTANSPTNDFANLFHLGKKLTFKKGEFIIRPGDSPSGIFYIVEGLVKAYDITKYGEENLLIIRKTGEVIGLTFTVSGRERDVMYTALAPTTVMLVSREMFTVYLQEHPKAALPILEMLVDMYRMHSERIMTLAYRSVRERLSSFLLTTSERFGTETPNGILIDVPLRHQDIASSISATRETTSRELSTLERQGILSNRQSLITLHDPDKLRQYLQ